MPPSRTTLASSPRTTATLAAIGLAARLRYVTIPLLVAHLGISPDAAYQRLRRLTRDGLLRSFPWKSGARLGPPSIVSILTTKGAALLIDAGRENRAELTRLLKSTSARAHDVEAGLVTTLAHDLDVLMFHALLTITLSARGDSTLWWPTWNQAYRACLDGDVLARLSVAERLRLCGEREPASPVSITYVPDATIIVERADGLHTIFFVELETGKGGRTADLIGAVKAAKIQAVWQDVQRTGQLAGIGRVTTADLRFAVWCPTGVFRDGFLAGCHRVIGHGALPILAVSAGDIPIRLPASTSKSDVVVVLRRMASGLLEPVWVNSAGDHVRLFPERVDVPPFVQAAAAPRYDPRSGAPFINIKA